MLELENNLSLILAILMNPVSEYRPSIKRGFLPLFMKIDFAPDQFLRLTLIESPRTAFPQIVLQLHKMTQRFNQMYIHFTLLHRLHRHSTPVISFRLKTKTLSHHKRQGWEIFFHFPIWEGQLFNFFKSISMLVRAYSHSQQSQGILFQVLFQGTSGGNDRFSHASNEAWDQREKISPLHRYTLLHYNLLDMPERMPRRGARQALHEYDGWVGILSPMKSAVKANWKKGTFCLDPLRCYTIL
jgi:hypothetical protein